MTIVKMNDLSRRDFLRTGTMAVAGAHMPMPRPSVDALDPSKLTPFVDRLPVPTILRPTGTRPHPDHPGQQIPYYRVAMRETREKVHRDLPPTRMWSFGGSFPGPTLEAESGKRVL